MEWSKVELGGADTTPCDVKARLSAWAVRDVHVCTFEGVIG